MKLSTDKNKLIWVEETNIEGIVQNGKVFVDILDVIKWLKSCETGVVNIRDAGICIEDTLFDFYMKTKDK